MNRIDSGELTLEESIGAFERGVALVKSLNHKLDEVERKVELLTRDAEGELQSAPFVASTDEPARRKRPRCRHAGTTTTTIRRSDRRARIARRGAPR